MYLKLKKCMFLAEEVEYFGMIVKKGGIQMDPIKLRMVSISQCQGHTILPGILQFLPEIHPFLLWDCLPPPGPHQAVEPLDLGTQPRKCILQPTNCIHQTTSPSLFRYLQALHPHDRCLTNSIWSCPDAAQCQQKYAIMWLPLPNVLPSKTKLRHL